MEGSNLIMTLTMPECKYTIQATPVWLLVASVYEK